MHTPRCLQYRLNHSRLYYTTITINMEPDMAASHIPFQLVPKLQ